MKPKKIFITGIIVFFFILLMVSFSFPDLFSMFYVPYLSKEGNVYTLVRLKKQVCPWVSAVWPPLYFQTINAYMGILTKLGVFKEALFSENVCPIWTLITNRTFLFWAKLPFLGLHLLSGWIFSLFFSKKRFMWFLFWLLNPIAIFINFIQGQFDSIPTFFLLAALYGARKRNSLWTALMLGLGAAYKLYPFLLLVPFLIVMERRLWKRILFAIVAFIPYVITVVPVFNQDFIANLLSFSENTKMLETGLTIGNMKISLYILGYVLLVFKLMEERKRDFDIMVTYSLSITILYFLTTVWFVQRVSFLLPLLLLAASRRNQIFQLLPLFYGAFFAYSLSIFPGLFDHTLLRPLIPSIAPNIKSMALFSNPMIQRVIFSIMAGFFAWFGYTSMKERDSKEIDITKNDIRNSLASIVVYLFLLFSFIPQ